MQFLQIVQKRQWLLTYSSSEDGEEGLSSSASSASSDEEPEPIRDHGNGTLLTI